MADKSSDMSYHMEKKTGAKRKRRAEGERKLKQHGSKVALEISAARICTDCQGGRQGGGGGGGGGCEGFKCQVN